MLKINSMKKCFAIFTEEDRIRVCSDDGTLQIFETKKEAVTMLECYEDIGIYDKFKIKPIFISEQEII